MIEINLVPDVKQELIKAQRVRASVISLAILIGMAAVAVVVLLALWVFVVQAARSKNSDDTIKDQSAKLAKVEDLSSALTIQNQLALLPDQHDKKSIDSRIFDLITTVNPPAPNNIKITTLTLDAATKTIKIEAQADNGYPALELFRKTILATKFVYNDGSAMQTVPLASQLSDADRSYGEDADGKRVLRFTLSFVYPDNLFSRTAQSAVIDAPSKKNVTDSFLGVPDSIFTPKASDAKEAN